MNCVFNVSMESEGFLPPEYFHRMSKATSYNRVQGLTIAKKYGPSLLSPNIVLGERSDVL